MVERDKPLDINDLPSIQAEKREAVSSQQAKTEQKPLKVKIKTEKNPSLSPLLFIVTVLVLCAGLVTLGYLLQQQQKTLGAAEARIAALEGRLSSTDESLSQSSVAMQVRLQELKQRTDELWEQMDKLWASAWRRNQTELAEQGAKIDSSLKTIKTLKQHMSQQEQLTASLQKDTQQQAASLQKVSSSVDGLKTAQKALEQQQKSTTDLQKQLNTLQAQQEKMKSQIDDTKGWIESNHAFRQQTNQSLSRIEQQLKTLNNSAP